MMVVLWTKIIEDFERKLGVSFPHLYKELLSQHNEIYLEESFLSLKMWMIPMIPAMLLFWGYGDQIDKSSRVELNQDHDVYGHDLVVAIGALQTVIIFVSITAISQKLTILL